MHDEECACTRVQYTGYTIYCLYYVSMHVQVYTCAYVVNANVHVCMNVHVVRVYVHVCM